MMVCEAWMDRVAHVLGADPKAVRERNMYVEGQRTHYLQELHRTDATARKCWTELLTKANVREREAEARHHTTIRTWVTFRGMRKDWFRLS